MEKLKAVAWWTAKALFWLALALYALAKYEDMSAVERLIVGGFIAFGYLAWQNAKMLEEREKRNTQRWEALHQQLSRIEHEMALMRIDQRAR
jgi:hypothetical protein